MASSKTDDAIDEFFSILCKAVNETSQETMETTVQLTPSSKTQAPYSKDVAHNMWRASDRTGTVIEFASETDRTQYSNSEAQDSYDSIKEQIPQNMAEMPKIKKIYFYNQVEYAPELEIGWSSTSSGMVSKSMAQAPAKLRKKLS